MSVIISARLTPGTSRLGCAEGSPVRSGQHRHRRESCPPRGSTSRRCQGRCVTSKAPDTQRRAAARKRGSALELAVAERNITEQRARALADEITRAEAAAAPRRHASRSCRSPCRSAQAAEEAPSAHDAEVHAQLLERNRQIQAQLASSGRELEAKLTASHARLRRPVRYSRPGHRPARKDLNEARDRNTSTWRHFSPTKAGRSVFEELIATLEGGVGAAGCTNSHSSNPRSPKHTGHESELQAECASA